MHHLLPYSHSCLYWCLAYIRKGISDLLIYVTVTFSYPRDRCATKLMSHHHLVKDVFYPRWTLSGTLLPDLLESNLGDWPRFWIFQTTILEAARFCRLKTSRPWLHQNRRSYISEFNLLLCGLLSMANHKEDSYWVYTYTVCCNENACWGIMPSWRDPKWSYSASWIVILEFVSKALYRKNPAERSVPRSRDSSCNLCIWNNLSRGISFSMSAVYFCSHLNLSDNSLSGEILSSTQFATLDDPSIYSGNQGLCAVKPSNSP